VRFLPIFLASILIASLVGLSNFDNAFAQTDMGVLILDSFPSSGKVGEAITFSGTLKFDNRSSEGAIVYIKDIDTNGLDNLLAISYVKSDGKFSAIWFATQTDMNKELQIYAIFEGNEMLHQLTTCYKVQTMPSGSWCPYSQPFRVIDVPLPPVSSTPNYSSGKEYIKLYYTLDFTSRPLVAIVPSPDSYDEVKSHITPVKEGILMVQTLMEEKYGGNWDVRFETIEPRESFLLLKPDIIMNLLTQDDDERCIDEYGGWAFISPNPQKPIITSVCSTNYGVKNADVYVSRTAAHEFLHAIGVGHAYNKPGDMMCSFEYVDGVKVSTCPDPIGPKSKTPSTLNLAAIAELYGTNGYKKPNNIVPFKSKFTISGYLNWNADATNYTYDSDRDGILDNMDTCPYKAEVYNGYIDWDGCPDTKDGGSTPITLDADHDGILNEFDKCPTAAEIYNGFQDEDGCPDYVKPSNVPEEPTESKQVETLDIPNWIRNDVKWWVVGSTSSTDFTTKGVVYMIDEDMVHLESPIPDGRSVYFAGYAPYWFKIHAEEWADGKMTNTEFVQKIQNLIDENILKIR